MNYFIEYFDAKNSAWKQLVKTPFTKQEAHKFLHTHSGFKMCPKAYRLMYNISSLPKSP